MNLDYSNDYAMGEEDSNIEYQSYYQGFVNDLIFAGNTEVGSGFLATQLACKAMHGKPFSEAENNALLGIISATEAFESI
jgi:hypothetical protein